MVIYARAGVAALDGEERERRGGRRLGRGRAGARGTASAAVRARRAPLRAVGPSKAANHGAGHRHAYQWRRRGGGGAAGAVSARVHRPSNSGVRCPAVLRVQVAPPGDVRAMTRGDLTGGIWLVKNSEKQNLTNKKKICSAKLKPAIWENVIQSSKSMHCLTSLLNSSILLAARLQ